jgi:hypothetical protein
VELRPYQQHVVGQRVTEPGEAREPARPIDQQGSHPGRHPKGTRSAFEDRKTLAAGAATTSQGAGGRRRLEDCSATDVLGRPGSAHAMRRRSHKPASASVRRARCAVPCYRAWSMQDSRRAVHELFRRLHRRSMLARSHRWGEPRSPLCRRAVHHVQTGATLLSLILRSVPTAHIPRSRQRRRNRLERKSPQLTASNLRSPTPGSRPPTS